MSKFLAFIMLVLGAGMISGCLAAMGDSGNVPATSAPASPERQVLVMLRLPPPHFRPDADYAGGGYGDDFGKNARRRIATRLARMHGLKLVADWPMPVLGIDCFVMEAPAGESPTHIADILSRDPHTEWAQPMNMYRALGHNDPLYPLQPSAKFWHVADIHKIATGRNVVVAVVDSGIEEGHPDLAGQLAVKENFVDGSSYTPEMHGTAVAGIIAARADNGIGIEGVAPGARLMALRACWQESANATRCNSFTLGKALNFAILHDAQVINLSLTGPPDRLLQRLLDVALAHGINVVGAFDPDNATGGFPASYPGVVAVTDAPVEKINARRAGPPILVSLGRDIPTTVPGARWAFVSGSSFAAAHVSGLVALLTELQPTLTARQVRQEIVLHSTDTASGGTIDACATLTRVMNTCPCACTKDIASRAVRYP